MAFYYRCIACLLYIISLIFLNTANAKTWYYTTTKTDMILNITGYEVEGQTRIDDNTYTAKINITTETSKHNWADAQYKRLTQQDDYSAGSGQLKNLLIDDGWIIDINDHIIKKPIIDESFDCKNFGKYWKYGTSEFKCPDEAAEFGTAQHCGQISSIYEANCTVKKMLQDSAYGVETSQLPADADVSSIYVLLNLHYGFNNSDSEGGFTIRAGRDYIESENFEIMTTEQLAQFIIENNYLSVKETYDFKNTFEYENSYAVLQVLDLLNNDPELDRSSETIDTDGSGNSVLPKFCTWAKPVCDVITWLKEAVESPVDTEIDVDQGDLDQTHVIKHDYIQYNQTCPPDLTFNTTILGEPWEFNFSFDFLCKFLLKLSTYLIFISYLTAAFIIAGVRNA